MEKDSFYQALKILINLSKEAQDTLKEQKDNINNIQWAKEYCTINVSTARRMGHTTAIIKLLLEDKMNLIYMAPKRHQCSQFQNSLKFQSKDSFKKNENLYDIFAYCSYDFEIDLRGKKYNNLDAIVVDNSYFLSKSKKEIIYDLGILLSPQNVFKNFFFIFIQ